MQQLKIVCEVASMAGFSTIPCQHRYAPRIFWTLPKSFATLKRMSFENLLMAMKY